MQQKISIRAEDWKSLCRWFDFALDLLISSGVLPLEAISRHIGLSANDIEMIAGLPSGYLNGTAEMINFSQLRPQNGRAIALDRAQVQGSVIPFNWIKK
ncbi:hypothetical protein [Janthinobacterium lividum]|uniref:Uncharacterized protein n=1 Tax=Janthinobacterium lividum TaxID=29581 RepID=A0ABU0XZY9_9BURK|nr:hypothetical protein [Janthinobacterium lividum]MDQ4627981.1 hypothetical protein [Janthinobacterium lividum]MDQ4676799.1 hypothetical protein [Janthinobacterium lividum]MDQ4686729.1 hypothetical protein [Janthinobacterium lividum]